MSKFKVGDTVRVTWHGHSMDDEVGRIEEVHSAGEYSARMRDHRLWCWLDEHLTLAPSAAEVSSPASFTFDVNGTAAPQGSKKAFKRGKKIVLVEMSKNLPAWRAQVAWAARAAFTGTVMDCPVSVQATFRIPKPKSTKFTDYPAGPPDTDKLQRAVGDALKTAGVITDDSRIVHWDAAKVWAQPAQPSPSQK